MQHEVEKYIQDGQDRKVVEKIHRKLIDMLIPGESINYISVQKKPAVTLLPDTITLSNKRMFLCEFTKLGLATNFEIFFWEDIKDMAFKEEIFGSKVTVIPYTGENLTIDYIPKVQARKLYQLIKLALDQQQQQEKQEILSNTPPVSNAPSDQISPGLFPASESHKSAPEERVLRESDPPSVVPDESLEDEVTQTLKKLKTLYDRQLISQAEYETKKAEILNRI